MTATQNLDIRGHTYRVTVVSIGLRDVRSGSALHASRPGRKAWCVNSLRKLASSHHPNARSER